MRSECVRRPVCHDLIAWATGSVCLCVSRLCAWGWGGIVLYLLFWSKWLRGSTLSRESLGSRSCLYAREDHAGYQPVVYLYSALPKPYRALLPLPVRFSEPGTLINDWSYIHFVGYSSYFHYNNSPKGWSCLFENFICMRHLLWTVIFVMMPDFHGVCRVHDDELMPNPKNDSR